MLDDLRGLGLPFSPRFGLNRLSVIQLLVFAIAQPAKSIADFAKPGRFVLPRDFLDVFDRIEGEVYFAAELFKDLLAKVRADTGARLLGLI